MKPDTKYIYILSLNGITLYPCGNFLYLYNSLNNNSIQLGLLDFKGYESCIRKVKKDKVLKVFTSSGRIFTIKRYPILSKELQQFEFEYINTLF